MPLDSLDLPSAKLLFGYMFPKKKNTKKKFTLRACPSLVPSTF